MYPRTSRGLKLQALHTIIQSYIGYFIITHFCGLLSKSRKTKKMILRARLNFAIRSVKKFENAFSQMRRKDVISPSKFCYARPSVNRLRRERHPPKSYFLMSGNSLSRPVKNRIRLLFPSQISFSLNWNRISFLVTEARAWNNSVWTVQIEAPMIGPLYRYLVHAHDPFRFSCKWFIPSSNRRVYNFFSYLIFFFIAYASLHYSWLLTVSR